MMIVDVMQVFKTEMDHSHSLKPQDYKFKSTFTNHFQGTQKTATSKDENKRLQPTTTSLSRAWKPKHNFSILGKRRV